MPELPEVQTVVDDLNRKIVGRKIVGIWFDWPKMIKDPFDQSKTRIAHKHVINFSKTLGGQKILKVKRRAKNILIYLTGDYLLLVHLKMTGHLLVGKWEVMGNKVVPLEPKAMVEDSYNRFVHLIFYLDDGRMLAFSDLRKFGKMVLGRKEEIENLPELTDLGPEPLDPKFAYKEFAPIIHAEGRKIKQALLDPNVIAGIGNIYSDDILWTAKIHPFKPAKKLKETELKALYAAMKKVLTKAVRLRGTSTSDFRDTSGLEGGYTDHRAVYGREGEPCPRCGSKIVRKKIGGRSAHFCPRCQVLK